MLPRGLLKEHSQVLAILLRGLDAFAVVMAGWLAYFFRFSTPFLTKHYALALIISAFLTFFVFQFFQIYQSIRVQSIFHHISRLLQALFLLLMMLAGLAFMTKTGENYSRIWFFYWAGFSFLFLMAFRGCLLVFLRFMRSRGWNERRVVLITKGELGQKLLASVHQVLWTGFRIVAILDDQQNISDYLEKSKETIDEIWLALPLNAENRVQAILHDLRHHTVATRLVLDVFGLDLSKFSITDLAGFPTLNLNSSPMVGINRLTKAFEDRLIAAFILLFISPLFLLIALGVKLTSKGPILFKQLRHGWDGKIIKVYKFRTMFQHNEAEGKVSQATQDDKRVTPFGKFLRKTSLDELPQFYNVLQGRMSIVGPRPHAVAHNEFYKESIKAYMQRHKVKPGITGWAQINGFRGETDTLDKMQKRVEYDLYYIENWSLLFDLKIVFLTFFKGFFSKNAY